MVTDALLRLRHEAKLRTDQAFAERERRRYDEVTAAFYEGMAAGNDALWHERPPEDYWLESDARQRLYAGPPRPECPSKRAVLAMKNRGAPYDPRRDPGRVLAPEGKRKRKGRNGRR